MTYFIQNVDTRIFNLFNEIYISCLRKEIEEMIFFFDIFTNDLNDLDFFYWLIPHPGPPPQWGILMGDRGVTSYMAVLHI